MAVDNFARDLAAAALAKAGGAGNSYAKLEGNNSFLGDQVIEGSLTINGDIIQVGSAYETHAEHIYTNNDLIFTREGAISALTAGQVTGIEAIKYDGTNNGQLVFDNTGIARVGDVGDTQPLLTRKESDEMIDGAVLVWDAAKMTSKTDENALSLVVSRNFLRGTVPPTSFTKPNFIGQIYIDLEAEESYQCLAGVNGVYSWHKLINDSMIAGAESAGIVKIDKNQGIDITAEGVLKINPATIEEIAEKNSSNIKPITVCTLDDAIKSGLAYSQIEWTSEEKAAVRELLNITSGGGATGDVQSSLPEGELVVNTEYYLDVMENISCQLPTGNLGDYIFIRFKSGETPTIIGFTPDNYVGDIPTPIANKTYELICTWNGEAWVFSYRGY